VQIVIDVKNEETADKIIWFLKQIKGIRFHRKNQKWKYWSEKELRNFGKIAYSLSSNDFDDEDEDYSKW